MRLAEADGKALLRRHGIKVPRGLLLADEPPTAAREWRGYLLKAQILEGGRGKRGLVRQFASLDELPAARQALEQALADQAPSLPRAREREQAVPHPAALLLEEAQPIAREIYVGLRIDDIRGGIELLLAPEGGEEVEQRGGLLRFTIDAGTPGELYPELARAFAPDLAARLARYCARLPHIFRQEDLELLEINPLVLTPDGDLVACDAKLIRDDSAELRHDFSEFPLSAALAERALTPLERKARALGFTLVELSGEVALVTSGAGLGMMMIDLLADHRLGAACFMDNLRGAPDETMSARLTIARAIAERPQVKAIVVQTITASRSLAERVEALLAFAGAAPLPKPLFVGIAAGHAATRTMSAEAAIAKLAAAGISAFDDPLTLVRAAAALLRRDAQIDDVARRQG